MRQSAINFIVRQVGRPRRVEDVHSRIGRQQGVGLLEVLIALVIASLTLLGLAGLHINSMRYQKVAHFRTLAAQHSGEMADRIRANMAGAIAGNYRTPDSDLYADGAGTGPNCVDSTNCTPAEVAAIDIYNWRVNLTRGMAQGWGEISGSVANGFTVKVYFREPNKNDGVRDPNCRTLALSSNAAQDTDVRCFDLVFVP